IQLVEALIVAATVAAGTILIQRGAAPGTALAVYSIVYGLARFGLELFRGDVARPYWHGASEAQWTSFVILAALLALSGPGHVPGSGWLLAAVLATASACSTCSRSRRTTRAWTSGRRVGLRE